MGSALSRFTHNVMQRVVLAQRSIYGRHMGNAIGRVMGRVIGRVIGRVSDKIMGGSRVES